MSTVIFTWKVAILKKNNEKNIYRHSNNLKLSFCTSLRDHKLIIIIALIIIGIGTSRELKLLFLIAFLAIQMVQPISYYFVTKITFRSHFGDWKIQIIAPSEPKVCIFSTHFFVHRYAHLIRKVPTNLHSYQNHFKISISKSNIQVLQLLPDFTTKIFPQLTRFDLTRYFWFLKITLCYPGTLCTTTAKSRTCGQNFLSSDNRVHKQ